MILNPFEGFTNIFPNFSPCTGVEDSSVCRFISHWLILLSSHWVDMEWDFTTTQSEDYIILLYCNILYQLIQIADIFILLTICTDKVYMGSRSALTLLTENEPPLNDRNSDHIGEFKQKSISLEWLIIWPIKVVYFHNPGLTNIMQV